MRERVPVRTIVTAIGLLLLTALAVLLVMRLERVLIWGVVAAFFAVVLAPVVGFAQRRLRLRRSLATLLVFLLGFVLLAAIVALLVTPLITQGSHVADRLPGYVNDAQNGRGPVGDLLRRFNVHKYVAEHQDTLKAQLSKVGAGAAGVAKTVANTVAGIVTVFVLAYLMVLEGRKLVAGTLALLPEGRRHRVQRVADDCARSLIGYVTGNVLISIICGTLTWIVLLVTGVPFAGVIAVFVGLVDLLPLVGATIGGAVAVLAGFVHSVTAGIAVLVFFVIYQQLGEPPPATGDHVADGQAQPAGRVRRGARGGGARRGTGRPARHSGGRHDPDHRPRRVRPPARPVEADPHDGRGRGTDRPGRD